MITLTCFVCQAIFQRPIEWIKNSKRRGDKHTFCSLKCFGVFSQKPPIEVLCCECHKPILRSQTEINKANKKGKNIFCSHTCSATYNNRINPYKKPKKPRKCQECSCEYFYVYGENGHKSKNFCLKCSTEKQEYIHRIRNITLKEFEVIEIEKNGHTAWKHAHIRQYNISWNSDLKKLPCQKCRLF